VIYAPSFGRVITPAFRPVGWRLQRDRLDRCRPLYVVGFDGGGLSPSAELRESKSDADAPEAMLSVRNLRLVQPEGPSSVELIGVLLLAWVARCDDSLGAAVPIEVSPVRVFPERGKCVGLAGF